MHRALIVVLALAACATVRGLGEPELAAGIRLYEEGRFADANRFLQRSIDLGLRPADEVIAHKFLAFIHCVQGRAAECRNEFQLALAIAPAFELSPAEAGHPTWGPVFRSVKASR